MKCNKFIEEAEMALNAIRPAMEADGGGVKIHSFDETNKVLYIKFIGACVHCPSQDLTFGYGIQKLLKDSFPWLNGIQKAK